MKISMRFSVIYSCNIIEQYIILFLIINRNKVSVKTKAVAPHAVHDQCDKTILGPKFLCKLVETETEPKLHCIEDCHDTMYICDCNNYRFHLLVLYATYNM